MRATLGDLVRQCPTGTQAIPAFTCYNLEQAIAVTGVAESADSPVCLLLAEKAFRGRAGDLLAALVTVAEQAGIPACVQLDHVADLATMHRALEAGATAVMADGSRLPLPDNTDLVRRAVALAERYGASVEAELGRVEGVEDTASGAAAGAPTDPAEAAAFMAETGAGALAVAIGNVHGTYRARPVPDFARLREIRAGTGAHLTLHGASGLAGDDITRAIGHGVVKINVNTELRRGYFEALDDAVPRRRDGWNLLGLGHDLTAAVAGTAAQLLVRYRLGPAPDRS